jgi:hypothetical protein
MLPVSEGSFTVHFALVSIRELKGSTLDLRHIYQGVALH